MEIGNILKFKKFLESERAGHNHFILIGHPVGHSLSPLMHNTAAEHYGIDTRYHVVDVQPGELARMASHFNSEQFRGANVTIPYKREMVAFMDNLDETVKATGAVNTVAKDRSGLAGYNTDIQGFLHPLRDWEEDLAGTRSIVFGTGGAAGAIVAALTKLGVDEIVLVSRNPDGNQRLAGSYDSVRVESYGAWTAFAAEALLIVNATPLGMAPDTAKSPIRKQECRYLEDKICYDIVYNPAKTRFMEQAETAGGRKIIGGLEMLIQQGSRSFRIWTGKPFPVEKIRQKLYEEIS